MRKVMPRLVVALAVALVAVSGLTGCESTPTPTKTPAPTATPIFATDAAALAAAKKAYAAYLKISDEIAHDGGADPERVNAVSIGDARRSEVSQFKDMSDSKLRGTGDLKYDSFRLQHANLTGGVIDAYVCLDVSATDVLNSSGQSVTPKDRVNRLPLTVSFKPAPNTGKLLLSRSESWSGSNFC